MNNLLKPCPQIDAIPHKAVRNSKKLCYRTKLEGTMCACELPNKGAGLENLEAVRQDNGRG